MASRGKVRSLITRPLQSSDLAFEIPGVLDWQNPGIRLGTRLAATAVPNVDQIWSDLQRRSADDTRSVVYSAAKILEDFGAKALFRLRNHHEQIALSQTIQQRDAQYLRIYRAAQQMTAAVRTAVTAQTKHASDAVTANAQRFAAIDAAYASTAGWDRVKTTTETTHTSKGTVLTDLFVTPIGMLTPSYRVTSTPEGSGSVQVPNEVLNVPVYSEPATSKWARLDNTAAQGSKHREPAFFSQRSVIQEDGNIRRSVSEGQDFWHPKLDNVLDFQRGQSAAIQEHLRAVISELSTEKLSDAMNRDFSAIEQEVLRHQTRLMNTYMQPPYAGVITAIYKDVGEFVQAGEPVLRVENDRQIYIHGFVVMRAAPRIDQTARIVARRIFETSDTMTLPVRVASIRGHNADDDEWEVMFQAENTNGRLPLNYAFEPATTAVEFN